MLQYVKMYYLTLFIPPIWVTYTYVRSFHVSFCVTLECITKLNSHSQNVIGEAFQLVDDDNDDDNVDSNLQLLSVRHNA